MSFVFYFPLISSVFFAGAMQRSTCPDCGAVIGGERHQLAQGNRNLKKEELQRKQAPSVSLSSAQIREETDRAYEESLRVDREKSDLERNNNANNNNNNS